MSYVTANGLNVHVQIIGARESAPVVMLHGLVVGNLAGWYFGAGSQLAATNRVVMYDLRGHGKTDKTPSGYGIANQVRDLAAVIDATVGAQSSVALVGHSFGGLVALAYALAHPESVDCLVLVDIPLVPDKIGNSLRTEGGDLHALLAKLPPAVRDRVSSGRRAQVGLMATVRFLGEDSTLAKDLLAEPDISDAQLAELSVRTLAIYGDDSFYRPEADRLATHVADVRLELLPGTHHVHLERAADVGRLIQEFLNG